VEAKNLAVVLSGEILRRYAPQKDIPQNPPDEVLVCSSSASTSQDMTARRERFSFTLFIKSLRETLHAISVSPSCISLDIET
jgi:hypothetical protein